MSHFSELSRLSIKDWGLDVQIIRLLLAVTLAMNALLMLWDPELWYHTMPGVATTGPFNGHFIRDIGCIYLLAAAAFIWHMLDIVRAWPAALTISIFFILHGFIHLSEMAISQRGLDHLLSSMLAVLLLPIVALWLSWPPK